MLFLDIEVVVAVSIRKLKCWSSFFYASLIESGLYLFGVVHPSLLIHPSVCSNFRASSLQLLAGIQQNFMGMINTKMRCAYCRLVQVRPCNTKSYGPWLGLQYAYRAIIVFVLFLCKYWQEFSETLWGPSILKGHVHIVALLQSDPSSQSYCNYWLEFKETLWEQSIPRGDFICTLSPTAQINRYFCFWIFLMWPWSSNNLQDKAF
jgi:hypothetical protein